MDGDNRETQPDASPNERELIEAARRQNAGAKSDPSIPDTVDPAATTDTPPLEPRENQIGPYQLLEKIGSGGFGIVYLAEQKKPIRRKVAVKIIKPGMDTREVISRFEAERQALALMDHPNIATVLDAGTTRGGYPYFVMELVRGVRITEYCDHNKLTINQRLELFITICEAVQHAHQKGIIHRDIKPGNVLVELRDEKPVPKIIDFGVAKATSQPLTEHTVYTRQAQMIGTPLYMSPEQADKSGLDVDTRSDVYSLGVLLYELLTGTTPVDRKRISSANAADLIMMICEEDAPKPSTKIDFTSEEISSVSKHRGTEPAKLRHQLSGDLDWIVVKALEKDRTRRYQTASGFAADIQRFLNDEPVVATPPTAGYRFKKFARRNKVSFVGGGVVLIALVLGTAGGWVTALQTQGKLDVAEKLRGEAEDAKQLLQESLEAEKVARKQAEEARQQILSEKKRTEAAESIARAQATLVVTTLQGVTTNVDNELAKKPGLVDLRISVLESLSASWDKIDASVREDEKSDAIPTFMNVRMKLADIFQKNGNGSRALKEIQKLYEMGEARIRIREGSDEARFNMSQICQKYGQIVELVHRDEEKALEHFKRARELMLDVVENPKPLEDGPSQLLIKNLLCEANISVGNAYRMLGILEPANRHFQDAHDIWSKVVANLDENPQFQQLPVESQWPYREPLVRTLTSLAIVSLAQGDQDNGFQKFDSAMEMLQKAIPSDGDTTKQQLKYHKFAGRYGFACIQINQPNRAERLLRPYLEFLEQLPEERKNEFENKREYSLALYRIGLLHEAQNKDSKEFFSKCRDLRQKLVDEDPASMREKSMLMVTEARCGNWQKATEFAAEFESNEDTDSKQNIVIARAYAQASRFSPEKEKEELINKAVAALERAVEQGFADSFELTHEPDLKPLRDVEAFKNLVAGMGQTKQ